MAALLANTLFPQSSSVPDAETNISDWSPSYNWFHQALCLCCHGYMKGRVGPSPSATRTRLSCSLFTVALGCNKDTGGTVWLQSAAAAGEPRFNVRIMSSSKWTFLLQPDRLVQTDMWCCGSVSAARRTFSSLQHIEHDSSLHTREHRLQQELQPYWSYISYMPALVCRTAWWRLLLHIKATTASLNLRLNQTQTVQRLQKYAPPHCVSIKMID